MKVVLASSNHNKAMNKVALEALSIVAGEGEERASQQKVFPSPLLLIQLL